MVVNLVGQQVPTSVNLRHLCVEYCSISKLLSLMEIHKVTEIRGCQIIMVGYKNSLFLIPYLIFSQKF